jgi:hypothetical protein
MFKCLNCGSPLRDRQSPGDRFGELVCTNNRCRAFYTFKYLEDEQVVNESE